MKLSHFIKNHKKEISKEWVKYAQDNISGVSKLQLVVVEDHIKLMLDRIVASMETTETGLQQEEKSKGNKNMQADENLAAYLHGEQRADDGFTVKEVRAEFRALRASILRLWEENRKTQELETDFQELIRFSEAIDELWTISIERFEHKIDESKDWFVGILGHDLRNPLSAISGVHTFLSLSNNLSEEEKTVVGYLGSSVKRMNELTDNLLELTNMRLGTGMTINKKPVDLSKQSEIIVQEMQLGYPEVKFVLESPGPIGGEWDSVRLNQLITNLITNAVRHGKPGGPVTVSIFAEGNEAFLKVHNEGQPIPGKIRDMISTDTFTKTNGDPTKKNSYGLGLYIIKQIVKGHKGQLKVKSNEESGTTFNITLPRHL